MKDSFELLVFLKNKNLLQDSPKLWWPNAGTEKIIFTSILTQNTKWENVEKTMLILEKYGINNLRHMSEVPISQLVELIQSCGFKNQKSKRLKQLAINILEDYGEFKVFQETVTRQMASISKRHRRRKC